MFGRKKKEKKEKVAVEKMVISVYYEPTYTRHYHGSITISKKDSLGHWLRSVREDFSGDSPEEIADKIETFITALLDIKRQKEIVDATFSYLTYSDGSVERV